MEEITKRRWGAESRTFFIHGRQLKKISATNHLNTCEKLNPTSHVPKFHKKISENNKYAAKGETRTNNKSEN
jgi:hypothetical protein